MKAGRIAGIVVATTLIGSMALSGEPGGPRDARPGQPPDMRPGGAPEMRPGGAPDMRPGGDAGMRPAAPPRERMEGRPGLRGGGAMMPDAEHAKEAGASEQQIQALTEASFDLQAKRIDLQAASEKANLALERLMMATSVDEKAILKAVDAANEARSELFKLDVTARMKVKQILGDGILRKLREQVRPEGADRRGRGPGMEGQNSPPTTQEAPPPPPVPGR
jgi:hypothetical protein